MAFRLIDAATAIKCSRAIKLSTAVGVKDHTIKAYVDQVGAVAFSAATMVLQGSHTNSDAESGMVTNPTLAIGSNAVKFANAAFTYLIDNVTYTKAVNTTGTVFSAAHVVGDGANALWGVVNIYISTAGAWLTAVPLATQIYTTAALALAAAEALYTPGGYVKVGKILINSDTTTWTANTDDLTDGSDLTTATFISTRSSFLDILTYPFAPDDIVNHSAMTTLKGYPVEYVRMYLSVLTGDVTFTGLYLPEDSP
jgi:hypothetical protein